MDGGEASQNENSPVQPIRGITTGDGRQVSLSGFVKLTGLAGARFFKLTAKPS